MIVRPGMFLAATVIAAASLQGAATTLSVGCSSGGIALARDEIRRLRATGAKGPIEVRISAGEYSLSEPIVFDARDSGDEGIQVRYIAEGRVVFTADRRLPVGQRVREMVDARLRPEVLSEVRVVNLRDAGIVCAAGTRLVGSDGRPYVEARYPNAGWLKIAGVVSTNVFCYAAADRVRLSTERPGAWVGEPQLRVIGFLGEDWVSAGGAVRVKADSREIEFVDGKPRYGLKPGGRWFATGALSELDRPGEYYIDRTKELLYYLPRPTDADGGLKLSGGTDGIVCRGVSNLSFEGLFFDGVHGTAVVATDAKNVCVKNCAFRNVGSAVEFRNASGCKVSDCGMRYCARGAVRMNGGDSTKLIRGRNVVESCRIRDWALEAPSYAGAVNLDGCGNDVIGCDIADGPHVAILFWGCEHRILDNEISRACLDSGEMGAIYTGRSLVFAGNLICGNFIHDIPKRCNLQTRAIMLDDGVAGITIVSNRFVRCAEGVSTSGIANRIEDNCFEDCWPAVCCWQSFCGEGAFTAKSVADRQLFSSIDSVDCDSHPWVTRYPWVRLVRDAVKQGIPRDPQTRTVIRGNRFVTPGDQQIRFARKEYDDPHGYVIEANESAAIPYAAPFKDGDRVAFLGDGILSEGRFADYVMSYYVTRYPERKIEWRKFAAPGDTAKDGVGRLGELARFSPTCVVILYGMNDVDRGAWTRYSRTPELMKRRRTAREDFQRNIAALSKGIAALKGHPRCVWLTPTPYDQGCLKDDEPSDCIADDGLSLLACDIRDRASADRALCVDLHDRMGGFLVYSQYRDYPNYTFNEPDRIHPARPGDLLMALHFVRAQGAGGGDVRNRPYALPKEATGIWGIKVFADAVFNK